MLPFQRAFIDFAIEQQVLCFGRFTLKSGRVSPYFFNTGRFRTGAALDRLGGYYADAMLFSGVDPDVLFGPAYKGIPLVTAASIALSRKTGKDVPFSFNRKEAKDHGEGGVLVGADLAGRVLILDDVITAGTSVTESMAIIRASGAEAAGVLIALDRMERVGESGGESAVSSVRKRFGIDVHAIVTLDHLVEFLDEAGDPQAAALKQHREQFGVGS